MSETVLEINHLWKEYRLGTISHGMLFKDLQSWYARIRGLPDPHGKVGAARIEGDHLWALRDVSLELKKGDVLGIIGRNGAGKSTLLKVLSRVTAPTRGDIRIRGRTASLLEVGTGFHPELTGRENVFLNGTILGMARSEIARKFDEIVEFSGVGEFIDTPVKRYSSGMYVRLAFAVAAHLEPEILVVDEVLAVGDLEFQQRCLGKMKDVSGQGRTVLFVSHNMEAIKNLCKSCVWLDGGSIRHRGTPAEVVLAYSREFAAQIKNQASAVYPDDDTKDFQFQSVRLLTEDGVPAQLFSCDAPVLLECDVIVRRPTEGVYIYSHLNTIDGLIVWTSDSYDMGQNPLERLSPGRYVLTLQIPARTLGTGEYSWYLGAANGIKNKTEDDPGNVCVFRMSDETTRRGNRRNGFFSRRMEMTINQVESKNHV